MPRLLPAVALGLLAAFPAYAEFAPVTDKGEFLSLVEGRELWLGLFRVSLQVRPDGEIRGSALGWDVTGSWNWEDGYFCREMDWSGTQIERNCQLVEVNEKRELRFTVDRGAGRAAEFSLR